MTDKALPIGIEDFVDFRKKNYYYVDKTLLIKDLLTQGGKVNLFTRPRRFGKTLTLSTIKSYFEIDMTDQNTRSLFDKTAIMDAGDAILAEQGKYPVIFLSLKGGKQASYDLSWFRLTEEIKREYDRHRYVLKGNLPLEKKEIYQSVLNRTASKGVWLGAIQFLSDCLAEYHGEPAIILIDEYDVALENAWFEGFYDEMLCFIRSLFESALKTNASLNFAVITGCLRITKESIFTGLNNLKINSILSSAYDEFFGFTPDEVKIMLAYYHLESRMNEIQDWYDGYLFGQTEVYNPWSVIYRISDLRDNINGLPRAYWANTSSNNIVRELIERADMDLREVIESLINGGTIIKQVHEEITYGDIYKNEDNLWNFLFFTGYLKKIDEHLEDETIILRLAIPNREVKKIYSDTIREWFDKKLKTYDFTDFYKGVIEGDAPALQDGLRKALYESMSYNDYKEDFYHGFVTGLLRGIGGYRILSNRESGTGRFDLAMQPVQYPGTVILFEFKVVKNNKDLEDACRRALKQINEKDYEAEFRENGFENFIHYGVAFCRKTAFVRM